MLLLRRSFYPTGEGDTPWVHGRVHRIGSQVLLVLSRADIWGYLLRWCTNCCNRTGCLDSLFELLVDFQGMFLVIYAYGPGLWVSLAVPFFDFRGVVWVLLVWELYRSWMLS